MTLTTRLSLFSLASLGLVLIGFSISLYVLARVHLYRQSEARLNSAMNALIAAAEIGSDGVEWEPAERHLTIDEGPFGDSVHWQVLDESGQTIDQESLAARPLLSPENASKPEGSFEYSKSVVLNGEHWQLLQRQVSPNQNADNPNQRRNANEDAGSKLHKSLTIISAISLEPVRQTLSQLAAILTGLSLGIWFIALVLGRAVSRRALRPVTAMATFARSMNGTDSRLRIPDPSTDDELADLHCSFNGLLDRLQESFERQRRFTGDASHQLRNPLAAMIGQLEVALRYPRPAEECERILARVHRQALQMSRILDGLLFLARANSDAQAPNLHRIDLRQWLAEYLRARSDDPRFADYQIQYCSDDACGIDAHESLLTQLVDIIVDNAAKYSRPGQPIALRLDRDSTSVCLAIEDAGWGIRPEDLSHIFKPFYRSAEARRRGIVGVGLGLSIADRLMRALRGSIDTNCNPGAGSCFTLRFPRVDSPNGLACANDDHLTSLVEVDSNLGS